MHKILRWEGSGKPRPATDELAGEEPLEIRLENRAVAVTMRTPGQDEELAAGFMVSEGLVTSREQVVKITPHPRNIRRNIIGIFLAETARVDRKRLERFSFVSSSCGLCGKTTIDALQQRFPRIRSQTCVSAKLLAELPEKMRAEQTTFARTGGLHAAAAFSADGKLIVLREDIGRHNAVDKILGWGLLNGITFDRSLLVVSGRASFEIMQKALAGRFPIIAAVSAPSDLAVQFARSARQTLVAFIRGNRFNIYAGQSRMRW